jgi:acetoacetyl-CoA synthetase
MVRLDALPISATGKPSRRTLVELVALQQAQRAAAVELSEERAEELDGTELRMVTLWCDILLLETAVGRDDDFFALGADSLHLVELCTAIEKEFGTEVMPGELIERPRLADMANLVRSGVRRRQRPLIVPMRAGEGDRLRMYIVTGRGGTLAQAQRFVFQLEAGREIFGYEAPGVYYGERPVKRIDTLAKTYVDELVTHAGGRPYVLVGMSLGATVVQEMARLLEQVDRSPEVVVMFDCLAPSLQTARKRRLLRRAAAMVRHPSRLRRDERGLRPRITRVANAAQRAGTRHQPAPTTTPTIMFTSEVHRTKTGDPLLGWGPFLKGPLTRLDFPGDHEQLTRTLAPQTAPALDRLLEAYDAAITSRR